MRDTWGGTRLTIAFAIAFAVVTASCSTWPDVPDASREGSPAESSTTPPSSDLKPPSSEPFALALHAIEQEYTTPALAFESDGSRIFWSSGAARGPDADAADLWVLDPGSGPPRRVFVNPNADSSLFVIRGDGSGRFAFIEQNERLYGPAGSRLWYLAVQGEPPELIDEGDVPEGPLPAVVLSPRRLVWTDLHNTDDGVMSQLLQWDLQTRERSVLLEADAQTREYLFPSLDGDLLVYTTIDSNSERTSLSSAVWGLDLSDTPGTPVRLSPMGSNAFMGVAGSGVVVWQVPKLANPFNGADHLVVHDLATGQRESIRFGHGFMTYQSIGDRFITAETEDVTHVYVFDQTTRTVHVADATGSSEVPPRAAVDVRPRVAGDLLVFVRGSDLPGTDLILNWAELPN